LISFLSFEVNLLKEFQANGAWVDIFRKHNPEGKHFSWWSYRSKDWKLSNRGRRLDHIWVTEDFKKSLNCYILRNLRDWERPSDHVPVVAEFKI